MFYNFSDKERQQIETVCLAYYDTKINSLEETLHSWNLNKEFMFEKFGNRLRFSVTFPEFTNTICIKKNLYEYKKVSDFIAEVRSRDPWFADDILSMATTDALFTGVVEDDYEFEGLKITRGTKIMKAIRKYLEHFNLMESFGSSFTIFRDEVSVIKTFKRDKPIEITFSIHPVDFLVMSDHNTGWRTCYAKHGCHHASPIAWMNHPCAVVAYINEGDENSIPTMSWRCMFLINDDAIVSGIDYPYNNPDLIFECVRALCDTFGVSSEFIAMNMAELVEDMTEVVAVEETVFSDWNENDPNYFMVAVRGKVGEEVNPTYYDMGYVNGPTCLQCGGYDCWSERYPYLCDNCIDNTLFMGISYPSDEIVSIKYINKKCRNKITALVTKEALERDFFYDDDEDVYVLKGGLEFLYDCE